MIEGYSRPKSLEEALELLSRSKIRTMPIGGGSAIDRFSREPVEVVDLQALGLNSIQERGKSLCVGATATLQALLDRIQQLPDLGKAIRHESTYNIRQVATVAGSLVAADGRSPFATAMLALDSTITIQPGEELIALGDLLAFREARLPGRLITEITLPLNSRLAYEAVSRTPADLPIVCAAVSVWPSGRTRAALGGWGAAPLLAMDGPEAGGLVTAAMDAYSQAEDEWATAEYRQEMAGILVKRCWERINRGERPGERSG